MKLIKPLLPACLAAILAMASFGASAAMAESTALCKADQDPCSEANSVTHVHYTAEDIRVETSIMNYECDALFLGDVSSLGAPQTFEAQFTYTSCDKGCTRAEISEGGLFEILRTGDELAEVVGEGIEILVECGSNLHCVYDFEGITGQVSGPLLTGNKGHLTFEKAPLHHTSGLLCPAQGHLVALFKPLEAIYIES